MKVIQYYNEYVDKLQTKYRHTLEQVKSDTINKEQLIIMVDHFINEVNYLNDIATNVFYYDDRYDSLDNVRSREIADGILNALNSIRRYIGTTNEDKYKISLEVIQCQIDRLKEVKMNKFQQLNKN